MLNVTKTGPRVLPSGVTRVFHLALHPAVNIPCVSGVYVVR